MAYETEKQRERKERAQDRARSLHAKASDQLAHADDGIRGIPLGQPILVGHHSEGRHRRAIETAQRKTTQAVETHKAAEAAEWSANNAGHAITSDDPEAIVALESKLSDMEAKRDRYKAINKAYRKGGWEAVAEITGEAAATRMAELLPSYEKKPIPSYTLTNLGANIRRVKARIEELRAAEARPEAEPIEGEGFRIEEDKDDCRIRFYFDERPDRDTCRKMRQNGFKFSRYHMAWQRLLNDNGRRAALSVAKELFGHTERVGCCQEPQLRGGRCENCGQWSEEAELQRIR